MKLLFLGPKLSFDRINKELSQSIDLRFCTSNKEQIKKSICEADGLIDASMKNKIDKSIIDIATNLRVISTATTGYDHIDSEYAKNKGVKIFSIKEDKDLLKELTPAAELTWTLLLSVSRNIIAASNHVSSGRWNREMFPGVMLNGKNIGIVGCGRIGQWVSRYANAFGMNIYGYDPFLKKWPKEIIKTDLENLFKVSDFVTIHVHLSDDTKGLISKKLLKKAKHNLILINTSRGEIIDEDYLLECLKNKEILGAGLDVLNGEPKTSGHQLVNYSKNHDNLIITPHCGGFSYDAVNIVCKRAVEKAVNFLSN